MFAELEIADLCFFTPNQLELMPDQCFDAFTSISSLGEMKPAQIDNYKRLIERTTREAVYLKQWVTSTNDHDKMVIQRDAYRLSDDWVAVLDRLDEVQSEFFETVFRRVQSSPPQSQQQLSILHRAVQAAGRLFARLSNIR